MFQLFRTLLDKVQDNVFSSDTSQHPITPLTEPQLLSVALMLMVGNADFSLQQQESSLVKQYLMQEFSLSAADADKTYTAAKSLADNAVSLHEFTSKLKEMPYPSRLDLIESLWQIAYADGILDPNEESMMRKIADLLFIRHSDFIQLKLAIAPS